MNTMGKLLVIVNLLFALLTGAFLAVDFASRSNWREVAEARKDELDVMRHNSEADIDTKIKLAEEVHRLKLDLDGANGSNNATVGRMKLALEQAEKKIIVQKELAELANLNQTKAIEEAKRLQAEVALLNDTIKKREAEILDAQGRVQKYANIATAREQEAKSANSRAQNLFLQLKEKEIYIAKLSAGAGATGTVAMLPSVRDPNFVNAPPVNVRGLIQKIDTEDRSLVQITLGSDAGIQKDHTLEVFRLSPQPQYLGRLRILESNPHVAIGRVVRPAGTTNVSLVEGDQVATKLQP